MEIIQHYLPEYCFFFTLCAVLLPLRLAHEHMVEYCRTYMNPFIKSFMTWGHVYMGFIIALVPILNVAMGAMAVWYFIKVIYEKLNAKRIFPNNRDY